MTVATESGTATLLIDSTLAPSAKAVIVAPGNNGDLNATATTGARADYFVDLTSGEAVDATVNFANTATSEAVVYAPGDHGIIHAGAHTIENSTALYGNIAAPEEVTCRYEASTESREEREIIRHGDGDWHLL